MARIDVRFAVKRNMRLFLKRYNIGANSIRRTYIIGRSQKLFYQELAKEIRQGRTKWPVKTGRSKRGFYGNSRGLFNRTNYAQYVEGNQRVVQNYVRRNFTKLYARVLAALGYLPGRRSALRALAGAALIARLSNRSEQ